MDLSSISTIVGTAGGILSKIIDAMKTKKYDEAYTNIIDLQNEIISLQPALIVLQQENVELKDKIKLLNDNKELETDFEYPAGKGYIVDKRGNNFIKICNTCWKDEHKYVVLSEPSMQRDPLLCSKCNTSYKR